MWAGDHAAASKTLRGFADSARQEKQWENKAGTWEKRGALKKGRIEQRSGYLSELRPS